MAVARMHEPGMIVRGGEGFRVVAVMTDRFRGQSWAMVESCSDGARPMTAVLLPERVDATDGVEVRIGEQVVVVSESGDSRIRVVGWAEENGGDRDLIRVRMRQVSGDATESLPVIRCRVVGWGVVEVVR
jgi:hypothetical protein